MSEFTEPNMDAMHAVPLSERAVTYVDAHFRTPELPRFLAWIRHGPERTLTWGGEHWERSPTPKQHLAMAICKDLGLKVIQQNPDTATRWAKLAREGHDVWQVILNRRYLGVIVDGVYRSYHEVDRR